MADLNEAELSSLRMYNPKTYCICLGKIGRQLENKGLVEWVPPIWGNTHHYAITDKGRAAINDVQD
jgi:hypothetical protein